MQLVSISFFEHKLISIYNVISHCSRLIWVSKYEINSNNIFLSLLLWQVVAIFGDRHTQQMSDNHNKYNKVINGAIKREDLMEQNRKRRRRKGLPLRAPISWYFSPLILWGQFVFSLCMCYYMWIWYTALCSCIHYGLLFSGN